MKEVFPLTSVKLLDGPFGRQQEMNRKYLLKLEPDRLLSWFRREAGLEPKAPPYRGWESEKPALLPGHILGFYMSGAGMMVQATGDPELRRRLDYITDELAAVQDMQNSGCLLAVAGGRKLFEEVAAGRFKVGGSKTYGNSINNVFEPTYTWNKITLGLFEAFRATGNPKTKQVLVRTADWFGHDVLDHLSDRQVQDLLFCEHGSIHESFVNVYELTGDSKYLAWARRLCYERMLGPMLNKDGDFLNGYHANCSIPIYTGFERVYDHNGETALHTAAVNFWDEVVSRRTWVIGGNSAREHFFDPNDFEQALDSPQGPESCNSVNMLRLTESLYRVQPSGRMIDYYERVLWNHILAVHEPERGMFTYYTPLKPGSYRVYSDEFDSMWCCVGTGLEVPGKYAKMIYTRDENSEAVDVNLFIASELAWPEKGVTLRQETNFPAEAATHMRVTVKQPTELTMRIRHPGWVPAGQFAISVNGEAMAAQSTPGGFAVVRRTWQTGDRVDVTLPMRLTTEELPHSKNYVAVLYGPLVLSGQLGATGLTKYDFWKLLDQNAKKSASEKGVPVFVIAPDAPIIDHIRPVEGKPLTFRTQGLAQPSDVELIPFYQNHFQRYAIYWRRYAPGEVPKD